MDSSVIYNAIYQYFLNYEYKLFNTFLYDWESDFFAQSKSGYRVEVEVKISRGDFFKDFEKPKHKLFQDWISKKEWRVEARPNDRYFDIDARFICDYNLKVVRFPYGPDHWKRGWHNGKFGYWVNDYGEPDVWDHPHPMYAAATHINIHKLADILCPNQFYFACPKGMITLNELPTYAGLIFVDDTIPFNNAELVKKAPYLHKNHQDLRTQLLKKYYNLWEYKVSRDTKMEIFNENKESA